MLLSKLNWTFGGDPFATYIDFIDVISRSNPNWNPDEIVCDGEICVQYEALWKDEGDLIDEIIGNNSTPLTSGKLMFELHNRTVAFFENCDHCFFQGLEQIDDDVYYLSIGS